MPNFPQPKSFITLILIGYFAVALPLIIALVNAAVDVDELADSGRESVYRAVQAIQDGRILTQLLPNLERIASQYLVLDDPELYTRYETNRAKLYQTIQSLSIHSINPEQSEIVARIAENEQILFDSIRNWKSVNTDDSAVPSTDATTVGFGVLNTLAQSLLQVSYNLIDNEAALLQEQAHEARSKLFRQSLAVIPLAALLGMIMSVVINRPISQISTAIDLLGDGNLNYQVKVDGPGDMQDLGHRLNWLRQRLQQVEHEKASFIRHVSHELKTPLTSIREGTQLLSDGVAGQLQEAQSEVVGIISDSSANLQSMIENLLNYNHAHNPQGALAPIDTSIQPLVQKVIDNNQLAMRGKSLSLKLNIDDGSANVDPGQFETIVDNLLSNAIKYSPKDKTIQLDIKRTSGAIDIEITDQGPGIQSTEASKVFEPFFQGAPPQSGQVQGTGLGLSIVKEYVEAHGGYIDVLKYAPKGAHIHVVLPIQG